MMPRPITPTFFLVRRAIDICDYCESLAAVQTAAKTAIVQSRSSQRVAKADANTSLARQDRQLAFAPVQRASDWLDRGRYRRAPRQNSADGWTASRPI